MLSLRIPTGRELNPGAKSTANTQTRSDAVKIGKNLATTSQHQAHRVNLPKQFKPYVAPHSRTPAVSRANGSSGVCERIHVYLYTTKTSNVKNNLNIANGDTIVPDATVKQTRVGRKIHTPTRFVQMVHALVAPNDIYGGTSYTNRNNHNL